MTPTTYTTTWAWLARHSRLCRWRLLTLKFATYLAAGACLAVPALAETSGNLGIGAALGTAPGLSVQYLKDRQTAYHISARLGDGDAGFSADYQRFFVPSFGHGSIYTLATYGGLGIGGTSNRSTSNRSTSTEAYQLRLPLGLQCDLDDLRLSVFAEIAGLVGPLPQTAVSGGAAGGLRARF